MNNYDKIQIFYVTFYFYRSLIRESTGNPQKRYLNNDI